MQANLYPLSPAHLFYRGILAAGLVCLLAGCIFNAPESAPASPPDSAAPGIFTPPPADSAASTAIPAPTALPMPTGPVLLNLETAYGPLYAVREVDTATGQTCIRVGFSLAADQLRRCGADSGAGAGFVGTVAAADGGALRAAFGWASPDVTAVAVEFAAGGSSSTPVQQGIYLLVLEGAQTPRRAVGVNQFGNLIGRWTFQYE